MKSNLRLRKLCAIALAAAMSAGSLVSCNSGGGTSSSSGSSPESSASASEPASASSDDSSGGSDAPFVYATDAFSQKFNPFIYTTVYDGEVSSICVETVGDYTRNGSVIMEGLGDGTTEEYNGTEYNYQTLSNITVDQAEDSTTYTIELRQGVLFADGEEMNVDDLIFSMYALLDPSYTGTNTFASNDFTGLDAYLSGEAANVEGIQRVDDYTVTLTTDGYSVTTIYDIIGVPIAPMHYYGDESLYDYENNSFGFTFGDLSGVEGNLEPMGTGPYVFDRYENRVVYLDANANYWKGEPKIQQMQFKETDESDKAAAISTGTADFTSPSGSIATLTEIASYNPNGETTGEVATTFSYDNNGYGYVGMNAATMNVGGDPGSEASKNLRKGFGTLFAVYRDICCDSYYGDAAKVIQYPISDASWGAPKETDDGYALAYSVDVDGNPIYTSDMTDEQRFDAALQAAIGFFQAAGYTWDDATGTFTAAPEGAQMAYEVIIPANGGEDHPAYLLCEYVRSALETIGITLTINNPSDSNQMWTTIDARTHNMYTAAFSFGGSPDPDCYDRYYSGEIDSGNNNNAISDPTLDELLLNGRISADQSYRRAIYKEALDIVRDWAVEVPYYQRQNIYVYSTERVNVDTITPDITTFWDWQHDLEKLEMN